MMSYFLTADMNGNITGLYRDDEGYCPPPIEAVAVSDEVGNILRSGDFSRFVYSGGNVQVKPLTVQQEADAAQARVDVGYNTAIGVIANAYPPTERDSWSKQETEARAYVANNASATPLLTALATARGITVADLANRVIAKADAYVTVAGAIIGQRQARQDAIAAAVAANDLAALQAVVW